ncbi:hypothetical protein ACFX12_012443 [Malus domestica]
MLIRKSPQTPGDLGGPKRKEKKRLKGHIRLSTAPKPLPLNSPRLCTLVFQTPFRLFVPLRRLQLTKVER